MRLRSQEGLHRLAGAGSEAALARGCGSGAWTGCLNGATPDTRGRYTRELVGWWRLRRQVTAGKGPRCTALL
eukprot:824964-Alexandrium_andersonii.AAC.1